MKRTGVKFGSVIVLGVWLLTACAASPSVVDQRSGWLMRAQAGDKEAQYQLGKSYCCGYGPGKTEATALQWFCKAALQGHPNAQYQLGRFYGTRTDTSYATYIPQNRIYAYMWYSLAAVGGVELAAAERDALARDMSSAELDSARQRLRNWQSLGCH